MGNRKHQRTSCWQMTTGGKKGGQNDNLPTNDNSRLKMNNADKCWCPQFVFRCQWCLQMSTDVYRCLMCTPGGRCLQMSMMSTDVDDVYICPKMSTDVSCVHLEGVVYRCRWCLQMSTDVYRCLVCAPGGRWRRLRAAWLRRRVRSKCRRRTIPRWDDQRDSPNAFAPPGITGNGVIYPLRCCVLCYTLRRVLRCGSQLTLRFKLRLTLRSFFFFCVSCYVYIAVSVASCVSYKDAFIFPAFHVAYYWQYAKSETVGRG